MAEHPSPTPPRPLAVAGLLLVTGLIAWTLVAVAILIAYQDEGDPEPTGSPVNQRPTLAAVVLTPTPSTAPPTDTPTTAPPDTALGTPTLPPDSTSTRTPAPVRTLAPGEAVAAAGTPADAAPGNPADNPAACTPPGGWEQYTVQPDDTLFAFALGADDPVTVEALMAANCLTSRFLSVGQVLYLPPGAAENAPPSSPYVEPVTGPRTPQCPCTITVREGWRREEIADAINSAPVGFSGGAFLSVTGAGAAAPFDFVMERPSGASMEGYLFPGTYTLQNDTTAEGFRDMLLGAFGASVSPQVRADAAAQGVSFYQALIIASIVQREVRGAETQKIVASIYYNRFRDGMNLGTTVSLQYTLGRAGAWWPRVRGSDLDSGSPYNTYAHTGLPPTPIDNPGPGAIFAAVYPPQTGYYFHTASCDGSGEAFAATYEEHLRNVNCE